MRLCHLNIGECAKVEHIFTKGSLARRFSDLGLIDGTIVECVGKSPGGDPAAYLIRGTVIAIRNKDAEEIKVRSVEK